MTSSASPIAMKPYSAMDQTNGRQARGAAHMINAGGGPPAFVSALAVPDDPLDGIMQCLAGDGVEDGLAGGAWFDDFRGGSMDMSTPAGVDVLEEMLLDLPDPEPTSLLNPDGATATTPTPIGTKAATATAVVPDRPAVVTTNRWPSLSFSDRMDEDEDDDNYRMSSSSDSSFEDDAADAHWHPSESKKSSGAKRRQQKHHSAPAAERKQQTEAIVRPVVPRGVLVTVEGGGGGTDRLWCRSCGTLQTPLWRAGPEGPKTLCNACGLRHKNKLAATTTTAKRLPAAKPSSAKSKKNQPGMLLAGGGSVVRKKRSVAMRIDLLNLEHEN